MSQATKNKILDTDVIALKEAETTVALMRGQDIDSETAAMTGFQLR